MQSSGIKRGLAATAVAALAVSGLATAASADTINDQQGSATAVTLFSQSTGATAVKDDGVDTLARLSAGAGADVNQVAFQYRVSSGAAWQTITTTSRNDDGAFSYDWDVPAAIIGASVDLRAVNAADVANAAAGDIRTGVAVNGGGAAESVALTAGSALGYFVQPTGTGKIVAVTGTASATPSDVYDTEGVSTIVNAIASEAAPSKAWNATLDIDGYSFGGTNQIALGADAASGDSDAVEAYTLYQQTITNVTAVAATPNVPASGSSDVTVTVTDQNNKPIAGVVVSRNGTAVGTTDANGEVPDNQGAGTYTYHANADAAPAFNSGNGDVKAADVVIGSYTPTVSAVTGTSADGAAFDLDEFATGDIKVEFKDQNGAPVSVSNRNLEYYWVVTPFDGSAAVRTPATGATPVAASGNSMNLALPGSVEGTYELFAGLSVNSSTGDAAVPSSKVLTFKAGQADVKFGSPSYSAPIGGSVTATGELSLDDGTVLADRTLDGSSYTPAGNSTVDASTPIGALKTDASGEFSVKINDPATPDATELGSDLMVTGTGFTPATAEVDFVTDVVPDGAIVTVDADGAEDNTPGIVQDGEIELTEADGTTPLAGVEVTLTLDHGFFTDAVPTSTAVGALDGEFDDDGQEITVVTDANGEATFKHTIGQDDEFEGDGELTATVTGTVDGVSGDDELEWSTEDPLNVGAISLERVEGQPSPAAVGAWIEYDIFAEDQFGNPVEGVTVDVKGDEDGGTVDDPTDFLSDTSGTSDFGTGGDVSIQSTIEGEFDFIGTADAEANAYGDYDDDATTAPTLPSTPAERVDEDPATVTVTDEWYESVVTEETTSLTADKTTATVGELIIVTAKVEDTAGNPVEGYDVSFVRTGDPAPVGFPTNAQGESSYAFNSTEVGTQTVSAVFRAADGTIVATKTVSVEVVADAENIKARLTATNAGKKKDRLSVGTNAVDGTVVKFQRKVKGKWKPAGKRVVSNGKAVKKVKDRNGNKRTAYRAKVITSGGNVFSNIRKTR